MANKEQVTKNEETVVTGFKKLHSLYESGELVEFGKHVTDMRKRVEKLFNSERSRLNALRDERARLAEEQQQLEKTSNNVEQVEVKPAENAVKANESSVARVENPVATADKTVEKKETVPAKKVAEQPAKVEEVKPQPTTISPTMVMHPAESTNGTRTAIPSYIRGVIKHTPRPVAEKPANRPNNANRQQRPNGGQQRPSTPRPVSATAARASLPKFEPPATSRKRVEPAGKKTFVKSEDKRQMNKRMLIRKGYIQENIDEERMGTRKLKNKKVNKVVPFTPIKIENAVITTENLTVKILSEKIGKTAQEIIKQLMELGIMTTINSVVDFPTMQLVADALGVNIELKLEKTKEEELKELHSEPDDEDKLIKRAPIVTVMGHVDHGKTSLLDAIRKTNIIAGEAGGITQHIGAYSVEINGETITFLDTPGHEAFTEMRRRGATVTDIAILIVAADDGVMPQTVEAITHAKEANVPIVVAVNKIDKPTADIEKVKQQLATHDVICEEWGGDVPIVPISAKQNKGIDQLLETILLIAEIKGYRANPDRSARGYVIEAKLDKGRGPIATVIVQNGTLRVGDYIVSGTAYGRVRALTDDKGKNIKLAGPSTPVAVFGLNQVPAAGDPIMAVENEKMARQVIEERTARAKTEMLGDTPTTDIEAAFQRVTNANVKEYKVIIKADVQGSAEALKEALVNLSNDEVRVSVVKSAVGAITQSDVMLADVSKANIIGFNVKPDSDARSAAERMGVKIGFYRVIYEVLNDVEDDMDDMLPPTFIENITGRAQVRMAFKVSGIGVVGGSYVQSGKIVRNGKARLYRGDKVIFDGDIVGLKRYKDDAKEVTIGLECGIALDGFTDFMENDEIECYVMERETRKKRSGE